MNIRYYHDFIGAGDVPNRFEILTKSNVQSVHAEASAEPFSIKYIDARKFEPIRGSQATLSLISRVIFQFVDLHTDDMQKYLVKFYRASRLYWVGWLDSELYNECLSDTPPYPVEFAAADFNILERLKYRDAANNRYTDIVPLITHLKRCFDKLALPFDKLYIGCTTVANGVTMGANETPLHVLYMMSANFYDEDKEPMTCREVVESILRPFGLMMVQKDTSVFIYDYNTVKKGLPMKRYNFASLAYEAEETVNFNIGNLDEIGFMSTNSSYGFEEMINNVKITSSLYAENVMCEAKVSEKNVSDKSGGESNRRFTVEYYNKCENIENVSGKFARFTREGESDIEGCLFPYTPAAASIAPVYRFKVQGNLIASDQIANINVKFQTYINTRDNPFDSNTGIKGDKHSGAIKLYCNFYTTDEGGNVLKYCNLDISATGGRGDDEAESDSVRDYWKDPVLGKIEPGKFIVWVSNSDIKGSILDTWVTNSNKLNPTDNLGISVAIPQTLVGKGLNVPTKGVSGYLVFEITNKCRIVDPQNDDGVSDTNLLPAGNVKGIMVNDFSFKLKDKNGEDIPTDDYEFKSYVNKKVATDFEEVTLKCISANEEQAPIGRANILKKVDNHFKLQLSFTRNGQTDILERLLMCSIHSNFATKNETITVDVEMTDNPALGYVDYQPILSNEYLVTGCNLNFARATTTLTAVGYSADDARISDIPYD